MYVCMYIFTRLPGTCTRTKNTYAHVMPCTYDMCMVSVFLQDEVIDLFKFNQPRPVSIQGQRSNLTCNCYNLNGGFQGIVLSCENGQTAVMDKWEWLGNPIVENSKNTSKVPCTTLIGFDSNDLKVTCYTDDPASVVAAKEDVAIADCVLNFCKDSKSGTWTEIDGPCRDHRQGPLCGQCEDGYAVTPSFLVNLPSPVNCTVERCSACNCVQECVKCGDQNGWLVIFLTLLCGFLLVLAAVLMNLNISPIAAAILFFTQVTKFHLKIIVHLIYSCWDFIADGVLVH